MWLDLVEKSDIIKSIFKNEIVLLNNIEVMKIEIDCLNGWDFRIWFDLNDFPSDPPSKWKVNKFNTVQTSLRLLENEIINFNNSDLSIQKCFLEITQDGQYKKVILRKQHINEIIFELRCHWIYVNHISAYCKINTVSSDSSVRRNIP